MSVSFEVSPTLVEAAFRLPPGYRVVGVRWDDTRYATGWAVFEVETDEAPEGARFMSPHYSLAGERSADPVKVTGMTWFMEDGSTENEEFACPVP